MMNKANEYDGFKDAYFELCKQFIEVVDNGTSDLNCVRYAHPETYDEDVSEKLELAYTMYNVQFTISDPRKWAYDIPNNENGCRVPSVKLGRKEAYMLFSDSNDTKYMPWYQRFSRNGKTSNSMYGQWIKPYLYKIVNKLANSPYTRQCVFTIYNNELNVWDRDVTDVPCTLMGIFDIVNNKLNLTIYMRSNDMYLGTPYNVMMFTNLQQIIFNELSNIVCNLSLGTYTHVVHCLHVYGQNMPDILQLAFDRNEHIDIINDCPFNIEDAIEQANIYMRSIDAT